MRRWHLAKSVLAVCAAAFLVVGGGALAAGPAQATVSADVTVTISPSPQVNGPLANSGCYPSGVGSSYSVVSFRTTSSLTGIFRAAVSPENGALVVALYDGAFTPDNTVARCLKRTVSAGPGASASITWSATASASATDARTWSLVLFENATSGPINAAVSLTSNGTVSIDGEPLALQVEPFDQAHVGESFDAKTFAVNGTPPYQFSASGLPAGLQMDPLTGEIGGSPTESGAFNPVLTVSDSSPTPMTASKAMELAVVGAPSPEATAEASSTPSSTPEATPSSSGTPAPSPSETTVPSATLEATPSPSSPSPSLATGTPTGPANTAAGVTSQPGVPTTGIQASPAGSGAGDTLPETGARVAGPAVVGILVLVAGALVIAGLRRRRPRHN